MKLLVISFLILFCKETYHNNIFQKGQSDSTKTTIQLVKDLTIGGNQKSKIIFGSRGLIVSVDKSRHIFVADLANNKIYVFSKDGKMIQRIGKVGKGPGEFIHISDFELNKSGRPMVLDGILQRIIEFNASNYTVQKTINIDESLPQHRLFSAYPLATSPNSFLLGFTPVFGQNEKLSNQKLYLLLDRSNHLGKDTVLSVQSREIGFNRQNGTTNIRVLPFGRNSITHVGPHDYIYTGWNEEFNISKFSLDGKKIGYIHKHLQKIEINKSDKKNTYGKVKHRYLPAFEWFIIDQKSNVWVAVNNKSHKYYSLEIFGKKGKELGETTITNSVKLQVIKDGYAYGIKTAPNGIKSIIRYKIKGFK